MPNGVSWDDRQILAHLGALNQKIEKAIVATLRYHKPRALAFARQNAPWTDRTSNARNGLFTEVFADRSRGVYSLVVAHGVPYGIWLEVRFSGRFAIIRPTVQHEGPLVMDTAVRLVNAELTG